MQSITVSATKARNKFFDLLAWVASGKSVMIEKDKVVVASLVPLGDKPKNKGLLKALDLASKGFTYSKKDNPLRRRGAASFLGKWDK